MLEISRSGYYAWKNRGISLRKQKEQKLLRLLVAYHEMYPAAGLDALYHMIKPQLPCSRNTVHRLMKRHNIHSLRKKAYKITTNSKHNYEVSPNLLQRDFSADKPNQKWVGDITYIPTDEGWLYLAAVMDLCGRKIVGMSMDSRMTKQLTIDALKDAVNNSGNVNGCVLHSDMGSQYCSYDYQNLAHAYGFVTSMSRKGNCWDNAPMECFWGKLKQEWLNEQHFKTRDEAKKAVFEYIWIFYNRKRVHASNDYMTPEEYYSKCA